MCDRQPRAFRLDTPEKHTRDHHENPTDAEETPRQDSDMALFPDQHGPAEGFNSQIQSIKSAARGFHIVAYDRIRIVF
jgi:hypothetical protein